MRKTQQYTYMYFARERLPPRLAASMSQLLKYPPDTVNHH